jgi:hypothetical protein
MVIYDRLRQLGVVGNKRAFAHIWLGRGRTYLADFVGDDRLDALVPPIVVDRLRNRLEAVAERTPRGVADEIRSVIETIDRALIIHRLLRRP